MTPEELVTELEEGRDKKEIKSTPVIDKDNICDRWWFPILVIFLGAWLIATFMYYGIYYLNGWSTDTLLQVFQKEFKAIVALLKHLF